MFDTVLKHLVYDFCIGLVFDKLNTNFGGVNSEIPKKGDFIGRISHIVSDEHYYECVIKDVIDKTTTEGQRYHLIYVDYRRSGGSAIDGWEEEVSEYLDENNIILDEEGESEYLGDDGDEDDDMFDENIEELMNDEDVEFLEYPDMICLNSLYYVFYK